MSRGFTLVEVLIAVALLSLAALGAVQLVVVSLQAVTAARTQTLSVALASARLEELRGLTFEFDGQGLRSSDVQADLSTIPAGAGGPGLSPGGSVTANIGGYVDHLDHQGGRIGGGPVAPPGAAYVRRWAVATSASHPDVLVLEVAVLPLAAALTGGAGAGLPGAAYLTTQLARRQR
jgi:prepilin-type N-terminal cleavage/methylation domain-containing protein